MDYNNDYSRKAMTTCTPSSRNLAYMLLNLAAETGEVMGKIAKAIRQEGVIINGNRAEGLSDATLMKIADELGDVQWQWNGVCRVLGFNPEEVMQRNLDKLADRQQRGKIIGEGDYR